MKFEGRDIAQIVTAICSLLGILLGLWAKNESVNVRQSLKTTDSVIDSIVTEK